MNHESHIKGMLHFNNDTTPIISRLFYLPYFCFQFKSIVCSISITPFASTKQKKNDSRLYPLLPNLQHGHTGFYLL